MSRNPANLHWFPMLCDKWLSSPAILDMLPEQEGAYIRLLVTAWDNGDVEPSLPADDRTLAQRSRLGARWKKLGPLVRAQFQEREGRLYNAKLSEVWRMQQGLHADAVANGRKGGLARASKKGKRKPSLANIPLAEKGGKILATPQATENIEELLVEPTALTSMFPPEALGVKTPRPAEQPIGERGRVTTGKPDRLSALIDRLAAGFAPKVEAT